MKERATDDTAGGWEFDGGPTADDLFGGIEPQIEWDPTTSECTASGDQVQDQTAATVFDQLQSTVTDTTEVLSEDSPEDIIARADEPDDQPAVDDALLADEDELADLLLTDRTKALEFLWIDTSGAEDRSTETAFDWVENEDGPTQPEDTAFDWGAEEADSETVSSTEFDWVG